MLLWKYIKRGYKDVQNIFYPRLCINCRSLLNESDEFLCHNCQTQLVFTGFDLNQNNPLVARLSAIVKIEKASALFLFHKNNVIQALIHHLKYQNKPEIGQFIATLAQNFYEKENFYKQFDIIIPVPLHIKKKQQRGYNQMSRFGEGLSEYFDVPYQENILIRKKYTDSQTKKNVEDRRENVTDVFEILDRERYRGKHFLIIDDVITTGATIEACAEVILQQIPDSKVSVLAMAIVL